MKSFRQIGQKLSTDNKLGKYLTRKSMNLIFRGSAAYWENRYRKNGNSGNGSYGKNADYKATILNQFVVENNISTVIELGCGDGNQLKQFRFSSYIGLDVSETAIRKSIQIFENDLSKRFLLYDQDAFVNNKDLLIAELALSLDVIYHLVEDKVFETYMHRLFSASSKHVIIYAWDVEEAARYHVRHRKFTVWIEKNIPDFQLIELIRKEGFCDFFIYSKQ
ncbi:MAG TPA: hypothetical protein VFI29_02010 [Hanamia sp.]|nr:hypothetical protein [Hanamia sp.]